MLIMNLCTAECASTERTPPLERGGVSDLLKRASCELTPTARRDISAIAGSRASVLRTTLSPLAWWASGNSASQSLSHTEL